MISSRISVGEYEADPVRTEGDVMRVELLFLDGCPSHERLLPRVRRVATPEEAEHQRFLGSPTVRVDGRDVEPGASERSDYGLKCRIYRSEELGQSALPPERWIRAALEVGRG
jgi:hypothetical protein